MEQTEIIIRPVITEKSMDEAGRGRFTFVVAQGSNKSEIRKAVETQFKVTVLGVQTWIMKGKRARVGKRRVEISHAFVKKAIVQLKKGEKIGLFDIQEEEKKTKA